MNSVKFQIDCTKLICVIGGGLPKRLRNSFWQIQAHNMISLQRFGKPSPRLDNRFGTINLKRQDLE